MEMVIHLANGESVRTLKQVVRLCYGFDGFEAEDEFLAIAMDAKFDVILGMPWLRRHRPVIDWLNNSVDVNAVRARLEATPSR
ncbi:TPA: hypothetical protein N0F65_005089 [Lagenidium giganteum]|uniref:Uncharacterized protein n=1 Tax=Lagenidium giganteum TaxID=4803 RepID=A0AAV2Z7Z7_9STRA|nr:TPA: hypothetical protein N0F65_005089 [Lagenidium giganteum]